MKDIKTGLMHRVLLVGSGGEDIYNSFKVTKGIKSNGNRKTEVGRKAKGKLLPVTSWKSSPGKHSPLHSPSKQWVIIVMAAILIPDPQHFMPTSGPVPDPSGLFPLMMLFMLTLAHLAGHKHCTQIGTKLWCMCFTG